MHPCTVELPPPTTTSHGKGYQLDELLPLIHHRPGWKFQLETIDGQRKLVILTLGFNAHHPEAGWNWVTAHFFPVPPDLPPPVWLHWIFECVVKVELHEAKEFFTFDGHHPYAPVHDALPNNPNRSYQLPTTFAEFNDI